MNAGDFATQAGLASVRRDASSELARRRQLGRLSRPALIDAVIAAEGLITSVTTTEHEIGGHDADAQAAR